MQLGGGLAHLGQLRPLALVSPRRQVALDLVEVGREFVGQSFNGVADVLDDKLQERCHTRQTASASLDRLSRPFSRAKRMVPAADEDALCHDETQMPDVVARALEAGHEVRECAVDA
jgi:hypothetical protein